MYEIVSDTIKNMNERRSILNSLYTRMKSPAASNDNIHLPKNVRHEVGVLK